MPHKDAEARRAYNRDWARAKRAQRVARALPAKECRVCTTRFVPKNRDARIVYCSRVCNARAMQIRRYGLTLEEYAALVLAQAGLCAICNEPPRRRGFHIDHNHATGAVRGLLCEGCNPGLGNFRESPRALRAAADYLERTAQ